MTLVVHNDQLAARPRLVEAPRRVERAADIEPAVNQPARYAREPPRVGHNLVGSQP